MKSPEEMLEISEKATVGPWETRMSNPVRITKDNNIIFALLFDETENIGNNADFIAESREFVPWAAERLIKAEELVTRILGVAKSKSCVYKKDVDADFAFHCCDWTEWVRDAKKFFGE